MSKLAGFDFFKLQFDSKGLLADAPELAALQKHVSTEGSTDLIFLAHGFRNDENDATSLYRAFLENVSIHLNTPLFQPVLGSRKFVVAGIYWPSKAFKETFKDLPEADAEGGVQSADASPAGLEEARAALLELKEAATGSQVAEIDNALALLPNLEGDPDKQDEFVKNVLSLIDESESDPTEGFDKIKTKTGPEIFDALRGRIVLPTDQGSDGEGGTGIVDPFIGGATQGTAQGLGSFFGNIFGRVGQFLNMATWYLMKERSGLVGKNGLAPAVREIHKSLPNLKLHLVGHSLGGRLMAACAKQLAQPPAVTVDSLTLLQAAFSHFGISEDNRQGKTGFFRDIITKRAVRGPMLATYSSHDKVVGLAYAIASRLAGDNTEAIGDANDPFGGIGRNGAQNAHSDSVDILLEPVGSTYAFQPKVVTCLNGSANLITSHGDVTSPIVTFAFTSALTHT